MRVLKTAESVSSGHPDKIADQISDAILDKLLEEDDKARAGIETLVSGKTVVVAGEVTHITDSIEDTVRNVIRDAGYIAGPFNYRDIEITNLLQYQSQNISQAVENKGAGDQGIVYGYAEKGTSGAYMPDPIWYANRLMERIDSIRRDTVLLPDGKCQLTFFYEDHQSSKADELYSVVVSFAHLPGKNREAEEIIREAIYDVLWDFIVPHTAIVINPPNGVFVGGGPHHDTGVTGRKLTVDTYGGLVPHGGGAFSGKDLTKMDRSAAYAARHFAKNIAHLCGFSKVLVEMAYAFGDPHPVYVSAKPLNGERFVMPNGARDYYSPENIVKRFRQTPFSFLKTATYGHFGSDIFPWEKLDLNPKTMETK